jgi:hypothetical protein
MSVVYAFRLTMGNLLANLVKSIRPESHVDRRGRLLGNLIGMFHLMTGRLVLGDQFTEWHRSPGLARRCPDPPSQSLAEQSPRRASALGLGCRAPATAARRLNRSRALLPRA